MPITSDSMFRTREDILAEMVAALVAAIPDAYVGDDGVARIVFEIDAAQLENLYLAHQLLLEDIFVSTAGSVALQRHGQQYGIGLKEGTRASGSVQFEGDGGTYVPVNTEIGYDPGGGQDVIYYTTTTDGTIPDPGDPDAPTVAVHAAAGNLNGTYEYMVTFTTASGETLPSPDSATVNPANQQVDLSAIPIGGAGTLHRRIYRAKNGSGIFRLVNEITDNVATTWTDNVTDATMNAGTLVPSVDTAHRIIVTAQANDSGVEANAAIGTITELTNAPATLTGVTNTTAFAGGSDQEDTEVFRARLLDFIRSPGTGSPDDLRAWAENVAGVESATVETNTPGPGETTILISGPGGTIPDAGVIADAYSALTELDIANIAIHVVAFTPLNTDVEVNVTPAGTYTLGDVTPSVQAAIMDYINSLDVAETLKISGIIDAVYGLPGIDDVVVTTPAANQATPAGDKRVPGTITVT